MYMFSLTNGTDVRVGGPYMTPEYAYVVASDAAKGINDITGYIYNKETNEIIYEFSTESE